MSNLTTLEIDGITYYIAEASDGWLTGPCAREPKCMERLGAYETGQEVSEAAPDQCSRQQMVAASCELASRHDYGRNKTIKMIDDMIGKAIADGLHSDNWIRASHLIINNSSLFTNKTWLAGGYRIRKGPNGPENITQVQP